MQVVCGECGKRMSIRGVGSAMCPACGAVVQPPAPPLPPGMSTSASAGVSEAEEDHVGFDYTALAAAPPPGVPPKAVPRRRPRVWPLRLAMVAGGLALVGLALLMWRSLPNASTAPSAPAALPPAVAWDVAHRDELLTEKSRLDNRALAGALQSAYDGYVRLLAEIDAHPLTDPTVQQLEQIARNSQQSVFAALLRQREQVATATALPPPVAPAAPMPAAPIEPKLPPPAVVPAIAAAAPVSSPDAVPSPTDAPVPSTTNPSPGPLAVHTYALPDDVTDAQIATALHRGVMFLQRAFKHGQMMARPASMDPGGFNNLVTQPGIDALCVYALLHAGQAVDEPWLAVNAPFTRDMLNALKQYPLSMTYHRSLRAAALAVYKRPEDFQALEQDVRWLIAASANGAFTYGPEPAMNTITPLLGGGSAQGYGQGGGVQIGGRVGPAVTATPLGLGGSPFGSPVASLPWDNSNSQYGLLGVWSGAEAGVAVPTQFWQDVEGHWLSCQNEDGEWPYTATSGGQLSMTDAGLASLLVTRDYLDSVGSGSLFSGLAGRSRADAAVQHALDWLDDGDNATATIGTPPWVGYKLYGLERVGLASGFKLFGKHDWYAELARKLIYAQHDDGSWGAVPPSTDTAIDTAYALLFLARGRHPVLFNKLRFDGDWRDYPHDVANLTKFASYELERPLNWQVVNTDSDWPTWMDSPVLYLATDEPPTLSPVAMENLRSYALAGGLIFTHADRGNSSVSNWATRFAHELFPGDPLQRLPADHPVFSTLYNLTKPLPNLLGVSNGSRLLMVHSPLDMAQYWQHQWTDAGKPNYELALNLFIYANGKTGLHNRLESPYIPPFPGVPQGESSALRLSYQGAWDPEPYAWKRFRNYYQWVTHRDVKVDSTDLTDLQPQQAPLAVLTGTAAYPFGEADVTAVRAYVRGGGVLLIDACGGSAAFEQSAESLLARAFPESPLQPVTVTHPVLRAVRPGADDLSTPLLRPYAKDLSRGQPTPTLQYLAAGRGQVILSRLDLTTGLLGTNTFGINGYDPLYAAALVKNVVLWADTRAQPATAPATP